MQKIWFDTEFHEYTERIRGRYQYRLDPIAIGVVNQSGETYSAVFKDFNFAAAKKNEFLRDNVLDKLPQKKEWKSREDIRLELLAFIGSQKTRAFFWHAAQDAVIFQSIFAPSFLQLPRNLDYPVNVTNKYEMLNQPREIVPKKGVKHDVVSDAIWVKEIDQALDEYAKPLNLKGIELL